jgi:signal transduction histidine kinase
LKEGASDYVLKDHLWQLVAALRRVESAPRAQSPAQAPSQECPRQSDPDHASVERLQQHNETMSHALSELESRVRTRTQQLEIANQELEAFSYAVSHDLRAPLRGMSSQLEMLADSLPPEAGESPHGRIEAARTHIRQMTSLIDDLLRLSRISQLDLRVEPFDLSAVATEVVNRLRAQEPERQVEVIVEPGLQVRGDRALLGVALENLLSNAWKYSSRNERSKIAFGSTLQPDGQRAYCVRDDGVGFDQHYADKLFQPFHRMHRQDEFPGTGVGLATVDRIVRRHGGEIRAESAVGQGATFYFTLGPCQ